jgi:predicted nucleic acid-binding protein
MIAYIDASAFVPLLVDEDSSAACAEVWESADQVVSTRLLEIEAAAALYQAYRKQRFGADALTNAIEVLNGFLTDLDVVEIDQQLVNDARRCAAAAPLRGFDAVHCAAGLLFAEQTDSVMVSGDQQLLTAWRLLGARTLDTSSNISSHTA